MPFNKPLMNVRQIVHGSILQSESFLSSYSKNINPESTTRTVISAMSNTLGKLNLEKFQEIHIQKERKRFSSEKVCGNIDGDKGHKLGRGYFLEGIVAYGEKSRNISGLNLNLY